MTTIEIYQAKVSMIECRNSVHSSLVGDESRK